MKIQLISHASVLVETPDVVLWTDPWLTGKVFNESWTMFPEPNFDLQTLGRITHIWISHEHPDHFNIPTLRALPTDFKQRVTILFQRKNTPKIFNALGRLGFRNFAALPNRKAVEFGRRTQLNCYQVGVMDSCLAILSEGRTLLNINDAKINSGDCRRILSDVQKVDVVLNQFSLAGYNGYADFEARLPKLAQEDLDNMLANHRDLQAKITIPFASFVYFSSTDNKYMNHFVNRPKDVYRVFGNESVILFPGESYSLGATYDSAPSLKRFDEAYAQLDRISYEAPTPIPLGEIKNAFDRLAAGLHERFPRTVLNLLKPVSVQIPDLNTVVRFSVATGSFTEIAGDTEVDLSVNSQPLHFGFSFPYGIQTLGVSARFFIYRNFKNWRWHRILFSLNNAELYLKPRFLFQPDSLKYILGRVPGGASQLWGKLKRME